MSGHGAGAGVSGREESAHGGTGRATSGWGAIGEQPSPGAPDPGTYAVDTRDGRIGQVMGHVGGYVQLRPPGGGREWDCPPEALGPAPPAGEVLRARVRELNRRGRLP
ncbi:hypothetical protein ACWCP6_06540 [Streptomyces sp. NPDC002004]